MSPPVPQLKSSYLLVTTHQRPRLLILNLISFSCQYRYIIQTLSSSTMLHFWCTIWAIPFTLWLGCHANAFEMEPFYFTLQDTRRRKALGYKMLRVLGVTITYKRYNMSWCSGVIHALQGLGFGVYVKFFSLKQRVVHCKKGKRLH